MDIVLIHGLRGSPFYTWRCGHAVQVVNNSENTDEQLDSKDNASNPAKKQRRNKPRVQKEENLGEWLAQDLINNGINARIISIGYSANMLHWTGPGRKALRLREIAGEVATHLDMAHVGDKPIVFVGHSMGGLVIKHLLQQAEKAKQDSTIEPQDMALNLKIFSKVFDNIRGVVFYSTPHFGSPVVKYNPSILHFLLRATPAVQDMKMNHPELVELNDWFCQKCDHMLLLSIGESKPTELSSSVNAKAMIVPQNSSNPGCGEFIAHDSDYIYICKPDSRQDDRYTALFRLILRAYQASKPKDT